MFLIFIRVGKKKTKNSTDVLVAIWLIAILANNNVTFVPIHTRKSCILIFKC